MNRPDQSHDTQPRPTRGGRIPDAPSTTTWMRAVLRRSYGPVDDVQVRTVARPTIGTEQVLLEVYAAGLDRGTWHLMTGLPYLLRVAGFGLRKPKQPILGLEVSGRVVAVGDSVSRFAVGDEVFGVASGSFAEYAAANADTLAPKPRRATFEQAAVLAVSGGTALQALTDVGQLQPEQHVLVVGASGGVGTYAVQLAKALGAEVTGVASTAKLDLVRELGADHVIDYTREIFLDGDRRYDLILDIGGRNPISELRKALTRTGTLVVVGGEGGDRWTGGMGRQAKAVLLSPFVSQRLTTFLSKEHHSFMERLAEHIEFGDVVASIGARFDLEDTVRALRAMEAGAARGKSVIVVRSDHDFGERSTTSHS